MAVIGVQPLALRDIELTIDGLDDYSAHVDAVTFTPTAAAITWTGLNKNTHTDVATATWVCTLSYAQDWTTAGSLSELLYEEEGNTLPMTFRPRSGVGPSFTADVVVTPGAIGGVVNAYAVATVSLGCDGKPVLVPAV